MQSVTSDSTQNKLLLLFVFDKMEMPLSETTILDLCCSSNNWITYMDCKEAISQLLDASFIFQNNQDAGVEPLYTITPEGRVCLAHFFVRIPASLREAVSTVIKQSRMNYRRKQEYFSDYRKNPDGTYNVILKIIDPTEQVLEITLNVPNRSTAEYMYKKWEEKAANVFSNLYDMLAE